MIVIQDITQLPQLQKPVITIGSFDGVHLGHQTILKAIVQKAKEIDGKSVLITFHPHPRKLITPNEPILLLNTLNERLERIASLGIDVCVIVPFVPEFAMLSAKSYVEDFLIKKFNPTAIVIGYDHRFGNDRSGDIELLKSYAINGHFELSEISAQLIQAAAVSSTQIRKALQEGDIKRSNAMLGYLYSMEGIVIHGAQRGRTIGYPTANISINDPDKLLPRIGVYAVQVLTPEGTLVNGMLNIGINPTVSHTTAIKIEVHLFDYHKDLYDQKLKVFFHEFVRPEQKFDNIVALKKQLSSDEVACRGLLNGLNA